jgi:hypothetical protein
MLEIIMLMAVGLEHRKALEFIEQAKESVLIRFSR